MKTYKGLITKRSDIPENGRLVFGANLEGRHGKGAAYTARMEFDAEYGNPHGPQGDSYAIITKNLRNLTHPSVLRPYIEMQIQALYFYAEYNKDLEFYVAYSTGPNLNGYTPQEMADMFSKYPIPENMVFEEDFAKLLTPKTTT